MQLCNIRCQFTTSRGNQVANVLREIREQANTLRISRDSDTWAICSSENVMLGVINQRTASNLASLPCGDQLDYQAFMETSKLQETIDSYLRGHKKVQFDIVVNIAGPGSISEAVGQQLSERRLFLQRPYQLPEGMTYSNPQYLAIDGHFEDCFEGDDFKGELSSTDPFDGDQALAHDDDLDDELWSTINNSFSPEQTTHNELNQGIQGILTDLMEYVFYLGIHVKGFASELTSLSQPPARCRGLHTRQRAWDCNQVSEALDGRPHRCGYGHVSQKFQRLIHN